MSFIYGIAKVPMPPCLAPDEPRISRARACTAAQGARFPYDIAARLQAKERWCSTSLCALPVPLLRDPDHVLVRRLAAAAARARGSRAADAARGGGVEVEEQFLGAGARPAGPPRPWPMTLT